MKKFWASLHDRFAGISYLQALILLLFALVFIIVGSLADEAISAKFYFANNAFGAIFAYLGPYPGYVLFGATGVLFFINWQGEGQKDSKILALLCAVIFPILAGALYGYECLADAISNRYLAAVLGVLAVGAGDVGMYYLCRHADKDLSYKAGLTFLFAGATVLVLLYLLKKAGLRPRPYWVMAHSTGTNDYFCNWWDFNASIKESFPNETDTSAFESWPSAHAGLSGMAVLSVLIPSLNPKLKGKERYFLIGAALFCFLTGLARVSDGHHYVSDVAFGAFFGILFSLLVAYLVYLPEPIEEEEGVSLESPSAKKPLSMAGKRFVKTQPHSHKAEHEPKKPVL